jgi:glyoxylase-like metal-dependent hydrolase (beta-lactamase superfamily II)
MVLFDTGAGREPAVLARCLEDAALPSPVAAIVLTHAHADHSGGAAFLHRALGAPVFAGRATAAIVGAGDEAAMSLDRARQAGIYTREYRFDPCPEITPLQDGATIDFGNVSVSAVATPGHCADHMSFLVATSAWRGLVVGDALFAGGTVTLQNIWDCSVPDTCSSIRQLAKRPFDCFLPGHGPFELEDGQSHVGAAIQRLDKLLCPQLYM